MILGLLLAALLPATLAPPAPFPLVTAQSFESEFVAPGVRRGKYRLSTSSGPLAIDVVMVDLREPTVRLDEVLAKDRLISPGETVSSMAVRTGAVAGINADYFDMGQTNQPLNIVVKAGTLLRTPSRRVALDVGRDRSIHFETFRFAGSVQYGPLQIPLTAVNEWPPQGGASLLTPAYGAIGGGTRGVTSIALAPVDPLVSLAGTYRVTAVGDAATGSITGPTLAFGPAALAFGPPPAPGDTIQIAAQTDPPLDEIVTAVGGGPLLLSGGNAFDDPQAPAPEERDRRFPVAGAALTADGTLLLITVDGRQPALSVGLTRPEFGALMRGLGATDGMAFDSGGSATLVARILGEAQPRVLNVPSDGVERPVADGIFVYSDAQAGPASRLVVRPDKIYALAGAPVALTASLTDAAGHYLGPAPATTVRAERTETITVRASGLSAHVPVNVVERIAKLTIDPERPNPDPGATTQLAARASDAAGHTVFTGDAIRWSADRGTFVAPGLYRAGNSDATVVASAGGASAKTVVRVGRHIERLGWFGSQGTATLNYDFTGSLRAAYLRDAHALPGEPLAFAIDVEGDASGIGLRVSFINRFGEPKALTLAKSVDWRGWQRRAVTLPNDLNPPVTLTALYAVNALGTPAVHAAGTVRFRDPAATLPGTP